MVMLYLPRSEVVVVPCAAPLHLTVTGALVTARPQAADPLKLMGTETALPGAADDVEPPPPPPPHDASNKLTNKMDSL